MKFSGGEDARQPRPAPTLRPLSFRPINTRPGDVESTRHVFLDKRPPSNEHRPGNSRPRDNIQTALRPMMETPRETLQSFERPTGGKPDGPARPRPYPSRPRPQGYGDLSPDAFSSPAPGIGLYENGRPYLGSIETSPGRPATRPNLPRPTLPGPLPRPDIFHSQVNYKSTKKGYGRVHKKRVI